jgi:hypothetical protein
MKDIIGIGNYKNISDIFIIFFAILTVDVLVLFLARYLPEIFGEDLNKWYDEFQLSAVLSDVLSILLGFIIARYIYTIFIEPTYGWNPLIFITILVIIQCVHDMFFYLFIILPIPEGHNSMIDRFKSYTTGGAKIIAGDAVLMISSALIALFYKSAPDHMVVAINSLVIYALTYILYTKPDYAKIS